MLKHQVQASPMHATVVIFVRFFILVTSVIAAVLLLYVFWSTNSNNRRMEEKALAEARTLAIEMNAIWDYVDSQQDFINYNADGKYEFKGVYCTIAAKNVAMRFMKETEYTIRYARENPRTATDEPDEFEQEAIKAWRTDGSNEYYKVSSWDGEPALRYSNVLLVKNSCLKCHGEPAGTIDETGYVMEGYAIDDLAGISSIVIPLDSYRHTASLHSIESVILFAVLVSVVTLAIWFALRAWVTRPLIKMNDELQKANDFKSNVLTIMSHELRTPITSIIAFSGVLDKRLEKNSDEHYIVEEIDHTSHALLAMVNNVIDAARIEAGKLEHVYTNVDLMDIVGEAEHILIPLAKEKNILFNTRVDSNVPIIKSDQDMLRKTLMNLAGNAIKFTEKNGEVSIHACYEDGNPQGKHLVKLIVEDTGIGIAPEEQKTVFERFKQSDDSLSRNYAGSGLGLSIVRDYVESLGGTVTLESELGKGSTFTVFLPLREGRSGLETFKLEEKGY